MTIAGVIIIIVLIGRPSLLSKQWVLVALQTTLPSTVIV